MKTDNWHGAYRDGWQGEIVPEAFAHPAKYSRSLIRRIYQHAGLEGWIPVGSKVVDPFGGVALGALDAMYLGLNWCGVELEERFVMLGQQNIARWNARYSTLPGWGTARLIQGDSRQLAALVSEAGACVSSPPFADQEPVQDTEWFKGHRRDMDRNPDALGGTPGHYGTDPGNLGNMKPGDFDGCLASPPYADGCKHTGGDDRQPDRMEGTPSYGVAYGTIPGQLGAMPAGGFQAAVSSPPWESTLETKDGHFWADVQDRSANWNGVTRSGRDYGSTDGQLGNATDFWTAARTIVEQVYTVLRPGAHAIWVLKAYVRDKQIVDFPDQWRQMCEACGFETLHVHRAWLVEDHGAQATLDGGVEKREKRRVSFFRRLHMKKYPHLAIDYEIVLCQRKPDGGNHNG